MKSTSSLRISTKRTVSADMNDKNKFTRAEIEIFDQPALNYKLMRVFAKPFVGFAVPRLNTVLKKSVLRCRT